MTKGVLLRKSFFPTADFDSAGYAAVTKIGSSEYRIEPSCFINGSKWIWYAFATHSLEGKTPIFRLDKTTFYGDLHSSLYYGCWSTSNDSEIWNNFDTPTFDDNDIILMATGPLPAGKLYFSIYPIYPYLRTERKVIEWMQNDYVSDTPSGNNGVVGTATERPNGQNGKIAPALSFFGFKISKPSENNKNKIVLASGNHPQETPGRYALEGAINWVLGGSTEAETLLDWFDFFVYPCVNPQGVWGGHQRGLPQAPTIDHNRQWNTSGQYETVDIIKAAISADAGNPIEVGIDYHCDYVLPGKNYIVTYESNGTLVSAFRSKISLLEDPNFVFNVVGSNPTLLGGQFVPTYGASLGCTSESGNLLSYSINDWKSYGANQMKAIQLMLQDGYFTYHPGS